MMGLRLVVLKNAAANVVRGGASFIVALALPHFLTHSLSVDRYSAWVLMLQIAAYANFLDFGLQTAVARYVAQAVERSDERYLNEVVSTAFFMMLAAALVALTVAAVVVAQIPHLFHKAPLNLIGELRGGAMTLSTAAALTLFLSVFTGILVGLHRNEFPALAIGTTRLLGALAVIIVVRFTPSLIWMALCFGSFNVLGALWQLALALRLLPRMRVALRCVRRAMLRELAHYCAGLAAFSFGMLLVGGLDLTIVGYFAFAAAGYYGIASTVVGFVTGMSGAVYSALLAPMAVLQERGEQSRIRALVLDSSRLGSYVSIAVVVLLVLAGRPLMSLWVGPSYASEALPILEILLWAQVIRLTASGYSTALVAMGQQHYGIAGAVAEGATNLVFSVIGARLIGPVGVAWGTVVGAVCGVLWAIFYTMRRARTVPVDGRAFGREVVLRPVACFLPLLGFLLLRNRMHAGSFWLAAAFLTTTILIIVFGRIPQLRLRRAEA
jgi:O-antigen/teichoic acid export membrane protein